MLVLDVDRLKTINDAHGHLAGAEEVRKVGHIIGRGLDWFSKAVSLSATRRPTSLRIAAQRGFSAFQK
jgi:predicted signal transduction protein with EAL and GGDEF domain